MGVKFTRQAAKKTAAAVRKLARYDELPAARFPGQSDFRGDPYVWGKMDNAIGSGGTGTINLHKLDPSGGLGAATGQSVPCIDADLIPDGETIGSDIPVVAVYSQGMYVLIGYQCPPPPEE